MTKNTTRGENLETKIATPRAYVDRKRKQKFFKEYLLPKLLFLTVGFPKDSFGSIDITNKCNLRCKHCYFFAQEYPPQLTDEQWLERFEDMKHSGAKMHSCTWVGGEPLLRSKLIEQARHNFKFNLIVTNGGFPIPNWPDALFHISVDGLEDHHDGIRGEGSYAKLKKTISEAPEGVHITLACCLNKKNIDSMEPMLEEWYPETKVRGIIFDFYTPIDGIDYDLWLDFDERDAVINRLIELKRTEKYCDLIGTSERVLELMLAKNRHRSVGDNCVFLQRGRALNPMAERKAPCMFGPGADCDKCGCVVPFYLRSRQERKYILQEVWGDMKQWGRKVLS